MQNMNDLRDLLIHELQDLYSAEEQIIAALPLMIEKAKNPQLKKSLKEHLKVTEQQRNRLQQVQQLLGVEGMDNKSSGLLSRLFQSKQACRGMQGIIEEGKMVMNTDMDADVKDAAIICAAQKVEHYEICGYGTARSFARELGLTEVAQLLEQTLNEEHTADDLLTQLAESRVNKDAEKGSGAPVSSRSAGSRTNSTAGVRRQEPETEMVAKTKTTDKGKGGSTGNRGGSPSGTASRNAASAGRGNAGAASKGSITGNGNNSGERPGGSTGRNR